MYIGRRKSKTESLKECSSRKKVLRSICSKTDCRKEKPPTISNVATATTEKYSKSMKRIWTERCQYILIVISVKMEIRLIQMQFTYEEINNESEEDERDECEPILKKTWKSLRQRVAEDTITVKWYAVSWADKRSCKMYIL